MTISNVSTAYLASAVLPSVRQAQSQLATLEVESSTGEYADLGLQLGSQSGYELSLRSQDDLLQTLSTANGVTETNMATAQAALSSILSDAQNAAQSLLQGSAAGASSAVLQTLGQSSLQQLTALGNTNSPAGYVFAGQNSATAPLNDYFAQPASIAKTAVDAAFKSFFGFPVGAPQAANITASKMQAFLAGPFASQLQSPAWGSNWSTASNVNSTAQISPGAFVETSTNTNAVGFQQLAQGYAMLSEFGDIGLSGGALSALTSAATKAISQGVASITQSQAVLGQSQSAVTQANTAMSSQMTLLQTEIGRLDDIDPAQVAVEMTTLSTQLETAYKLTSQIHSLNLAQYLPA